MRTIVVDVDGVLLDVHTALEEKLKSMGYSFEMTDVLTYDFNRSLDSSIQAPDLGVPRDVIFKCLSDVDIFRSASIDMQAVNLIKEQVKSGRVEFIIYTQSYNSDISAEKCKRLFSLFDGCDAVKIKSFVGEHKPTLDSVDVSAVIEDSLENIRGYSESALSYLIDKPYNQRIYNECYADVFNRSTFTRCSCPAKAILSACINLGVFVRGGIETERLCNPEKYAM